MPVRRTVPSALAGAATDLTSSTEIDQLTGLPARAHLHARVQEELLVAAQAHGSLALLCIDLNDFKLVNDSLGHDAGDELLRRVARRLSTIVRGSDVVARPGGDEFMLMLTRLPLTNARIVAERIAGAVHDLFEEPFTIDDAVFKIGASVGISLYPDDARDADALLGHADAAVYRAKESGDQHVVYVPTGADPLARLSLAARLRAALDACEFELHYQPVYSLGAEPGIRGAEALIRWNDPERGVVSPAEFIPAAESTGVIDAIGDWVVEATLDQSVAWRDAGLLPKVGFNVSPRQLRREGFAERLIEGVRARSLDPENIVVELTESAWMVDADRALPVLRRLRYEGISLALDDFGAGYSSLARLRALPVGIIKIDRSFMNGVPEDPEACAIVAAILQLASACGCDVVAEGIETAEQMQFLVEHDCFMGQGFHLARPMAADQLTPLLHATSIAERRR